MLLLYAGLLAAAKDPQLIPRHFASKIQNPKTYSLRFAKLIALTSAAPLLSGLVGFTRQMWAAGIVLIAAFVLCIHFGIRLFMHDL